MVALQGHDNAPRVGLPYYYHTTTILPYRSTTIVHSLSMCVWGLQCVGGPMSMHHEIVVSPSAPDLWKYTPSHSPLTLPAPSHPQASRGEAAPQSPPGVCGPGDGQAAREAAEAVQAVLAAAPGSGDMAGQQVRAPCFVTVLCCSEHTSLCSSTLCYCQQCRPDHLGHTATSVICTAGLRLCLRSRNSPVHAACCVPDGCLCVPSLPPRALQGLLWGTHGRLPWAQCLSTQRHCRSVSGSVGCT